MSPRGPIVKTRLSDRLIFPKPTIKPQNGYITSIIERVMKLLVNS